MAGSGPGTGVLSCCYHRGVFCNLARRRLALWFVCAIPALAVPAAAGHGEDAQPPSLWTRSRGADWPGFLGAQGDGTSPETGIRTDWSAGLPILWQRRLGEGYGAPAIARGRLFVFDRHRGMARLTCLDAETGAEIWQREYATAYEDYYGYSNGPRASPVIDGDRVYTFGAEGRLRCHRVVDGELLWEVDTATRFGVVQNFFGVGSTPAIEGGLVIAQVGGSPPGSPKVHSGLVAPNGSAVVAFDKRTGEVRYAVGDDLASYAAVRLATIGGRRWGLVFARGGLLGFEPSTGAVDFHFPWRARVLESVNASTPVVVGDRVLISETYGPGGALLAVRPGAAEVVWTDAPRRDKSLACHWSTPIHVDGVIYASTGRHAAGAELRAVELETGRLLWREPGLQRTSLLAVDGHLIALSEDGTLRLIRLDRERFAKIGEIVLRDHGQSLIRPPAWNAPILAHGILYLRGKDRLVAIELIPR
jgi:outer membrane protein assembly factor BamB